MSPTSSTSTTGTQTILRVSGIRKNFRMGETDVTVLKHIDLAVRRGEFLAIEGRSGSGKSTLLHILGALESVDGGTLDFEGQDYTRRSDANTSGVIHFVAGPPMRWAIRISGAIAAAAWIGETLIRTAKPTAWVSVLHQMLTPAFLRILAGLFLLFTVTYWLTKLGIFIHKYLEERVPARLRNKDFGFVFQFYHLLPELNVLENTLLVPMVELSWFGFRSRRKHLVQRATQLLEQLGLSHRLKHRPNQLSGGERQRVAIARALMNNPKVLFADEPTGNLDAETGRQIMDVLEKLHQDHAQTILMVTHDRTLAAEADRILLLKDGRLTTEPK